MRSYSNMTVNSVREKLLFSVGFGLCLFLLGQVTAVIIQTAGNNGYDVSLELLSAEVCFNQTVSLICQHPRVPLEMFSSTRPSWKEDGIVIALDGGMYRSVTRINETHIVLELVPDQSHFEPTGVHNYSCFFHLVGGGVLESNPVPVRPQDKPQLPEMVSIIPGIWSARVQWQDDRNFPCFHSQACGLEYYLYWQLLSGGSQEINNAITTSTVYTITDLHPAVEYSFTMNVGCKNDPSLKSGNFTISVFTTKGLEDAVTLSASSLTTCFDTPVDLHCRHPDSTFTIEGKPMFASMSPLWRLNGTIIALDGITYKGYYYNETETVLRLVYNRKEFVYSQFIYTCSFNLYNGTLVESNPQEVQINVTYSRYFQFTVPIEQGSNKSLDWSSVVACSPFITSYTRFNVTQVPVGISGSQPNLRLAKSYITQSLTSQKLLFSTTSNYSYVLVSLQILEDDITLELNATDTPCTERPFTLTCTSSRPPTECNSTQVEWFADDETLPVFSSGLYMETHLGPKVTYLTFVPYDNYTVYSCGLPTCGHSNNYIVQPQTTPKPPLITFINSSNSFMSLNWTHNRTCFESDPVEYHVMLNSDTLFSSTDQMHMTAQIFDITPGEIYNVTVVAMVRAANGKQWSIADSERITAGHPLVQSEEVPKCFGQTFMFTCHHHYNTTTPPVWLIDGTQVEHDGQDFTINETDGAIRLYLSQCRYAQRKTFFQCCVEVRNIQVCGDRYLIEPVEYPSAPTVNVMSVGMDSISLSWEISKACFESVNFTTAIILKSVSDGQTHAAFVSGNSHAFTGLTSGTSYNITVFAIGDRLQSDSMSTTATTSTAIGLGGAAAVAIGIFTGIACIVAIAIIAICTLIAIRHYKRRTTNIRNDDADDLTLSRM